MAHPVLYISPDTAGLIYINGHLAGECGPDSPLVTPAPPQGMLYMELRPFSDGFAPMTRRMAFSGGHVAGSAAPDGMYIVEWPGSVIDVQLSPERVGDLCGALRLSAGGCDIYVSPQRPATACVVRGARLMTSRMPNAVSEARALETPDGRIMLIGRCAGGEFAQVLDAEGGAVALNVEGRAISPAGHGGVQVIRALNDEAGHELRELWRPEGRGYVCEVQGVRIAGERSAPVSAESAALRLGQALLLGQEAEARALLTPGAQARLRQLRAVAERCDACCALKYGAREGAIGAMKLLSPGYARVYAMEYAAVGAPEGWLIDDLRLPDMDA